MIWESLQRNPVRTSYQSPILPKAHTEGQYHLVNIPMKSIENHPYHYLQETNCWKRKVVQRYPNRNNDIWLFQTFCAILCWITEHLLFLSNQDLHSVDLLALMHNFLWIISCHQFFPIFLVFIVTPSAPTHFNLFEKRQKLYWKNNLMANEIRK